MLTALLLIACSQSVTDVWEDYDHYLYVDGDAVDERCAASPEAVFTLDTSWTMEARWEHTAYLTIWAGDDMDEITCDEYEHLGAQGCLWSIERGEVLVVEPIPVHVDCAANALTSYFGVGALDRRGHTLEGLVIDPALDYGSSGT